MNATVNTCFHCGEPVPLRGAARARIGADDHEFCCGGCAAAALWITGAGLEGYYRARTRPALAPRATESAARWDAPSFLETHSVAHGEYRAITLVVEGVRCAACAWLIERALAGVPGVTGSSVNAATARLSLEWNPAETGLSQPIQLLARLGYRVHRPARDDAHALVRERRGSLKRLAVAGLGAMQAMMLSEALTFGADGLDIATRDFFRWITFLFATPVVFYAGWPFLRSAWREIVLRRPGMDLLVAVSVLLAWGVSTVETLRGGDAVYFDAAVMFILFLLAARHLETEARRKATAALDVLARAQPDLATRIDATGAETLVAVSSLEPGDRVRVRVGDAVPADGVLLDQAAELDESFVSGESRAIPHVPGEALLAGSVALSCPLTLCVTRRAGESTVARLAELAARAQAMRPRAARLADRVASVFVVVMLGVALVVGVAWWWIEPARVLPVVLAVLAATCPCALALAVPAAIAAAQARLAQDGALVLDADAVETLARADTVILDKTGTLTLGRPRIAGEEIFHGTRAAALAEAAALERGLHHPLAAAFAPFDDGQSVSDVRVVPGAGIEGRIRGSIRRIGTRAFATGGGEDDAIWLGDGRRALARFSYEDAPRSGAAETIAELAASGMTIEVLSGDSEPRVASLARQLGIARWRARCSPAAKLAHVSGLQSRGHCVAMVGDGVNDAAVLAGADVAIAIADGAALAHASASVVLTGENFGRLFPVFETAQRARRIVRQNFGWAIAYNGIALPLAAADLVAPWLAALGMSVSSLVVTLNALRLIRPARKEAGRQAATIGPLAEVTP